MLSGTDAIGLPCTYTQLTALTKESGYYSQVGEVVTRWILRHSRKNLPEDSNSSIAEARTEFRSKLGSGRGTNKNLGKWIYPGKIDPLVTVGAIMTKNKDGDAFDLLVSAAEIDVKRKDNMPSPTAGGRMTTSGQAVTVGATQGSSGVESKQAQQIRKLTLMEAYDYARRAKDLTETRNHVQGSEGSSPTIYLVIGTTTIDEDTSNVSGPALSSTPILSKDKTTSVSGDSSVKGLQVCIVTYRGKATR